MAESMNDEDREWLETDLSRLAGYDPYELSEEQLADERPKGTSPASDWSWRAVRTLG